MNISYIVCLFLAVFSSACDDDKTDENNAKQVTVTISPSDKVIVEGEGGDLSLIHICLLLPFPGSMG